MDEQRPAVVSLGLDEATMTRARTRFVEIERHGEAFLDLPQAGDPWCPLTVRARLERMAWAYGFLPRVRPSKVRSCMPETVRERWKDAPKDAPADDETPDNLDVVHAHQVVDVLTQQQRLVAWAIAEQKADRWLGRKLGCHNMTACTRKQQMLDHLARDWCNRDFRPHARDIAWVGKYFIHQNSSEAYSTGR